MYRACFCKVHHCSLAAAGHEKAFGVWQYSLYYERKKKRIGWMINRILFADVHRRLCCLHLILIYLSTFCRFEANVGISPASSLTALLAIIAYLGYYSTQA